MRKVVQLQCFPSLTPAQYSFFTVAGGEASFGSCFMYLLPCFMNPKVTAFYKLRYEEANSNFSPLQKDSNEPQCGFLNETAL